MKRYKRVFIIVLDSFGIGAQPDAHLFGDEGADTLGSLVRTGELCVPNLRSLGLFNIDGVSGISGVEKPLGAYARLEEQSRGKDTTIGHYELMGIYSPRPMPTYPEGFPRELISEFERRVGREVICNLPYSGTDVIRDYGEEHEKTGKLIVYTSADSVFQIAAHESVIPPEELYSICRVAREMLTGEHAVGRVIARPFIGTAGNYTRTANRRDFSLLPPKKSLLNAISESGLAVIGIGKIGDIFALSGISRTIPTHSNEEGMDVLLELLCEDFRGLGFLNLVEFDSHYGHRQDASGYARAINAFDVRLGEVMARLREDDLLMICADHGCDPSDESTDHTREYTPLLVYGNGIEAENLGTKKGFFLVGEIAAEGLGVDFVSDGAAETDKLNAPKE